MTIILGISAKNAEYNISAIQNGKLINNCVVYSSWAMCFFLVTSVLTPNRGASMWIECTGLLSFNNAVTVGAVSEGYDLVI